MLYGFELKDACLVIEYQEVKSEKEKEGKEKEGKEIEILSISLYAKDTATYSSIYAPIKLLEDTYGLSNADPTAHEAIHKMMGELMKVEPENTKTFSTHFHWVCKPALNMDLFVGFLSQIKKTLGPAFKKVCEGASKNFK